MEPFEIPVFNEQNSTRKKVWVPSSDHDGRFGLNAGDETKRFSTRNVFLYVAICLTGILLNGSLQLLAAAEEAAAKGQKKTIVFDPGHGGYDTGAEGSDGIYEKTVTLAFARIIGEALENKYSVHETRTGDYNVDITERTAVANHLKADLFISIHTGGSSVRKINGISIFCFSEKWDPVLKTEARPEKPAEGDNARIPWDQLQLGHTAASGTLAKRIGSRLSDQLKIEDVRIQGAPVLVLEGAAMPAVLIEIGYLTNPTDEKRLMDRKMLQDFAHAVGDGIDDFFTGRTDE